VDETLESTEFVGSLVTGVPFEVLPPFGKQVIV
jgi:hypothetical protein